jgi:hypothetical protein
MGKIAGENIADTENQVFYSYNGNTCVRTMPGKESARILSNTIF